MANKLTLSERQQGILDYIWHYAESTGRPPTIREIGREVKISSTSVVNYNLAKLEEKGYLDREADVSRGLRLTEKAEQLFQTASESLKNAVQNIVRVPMAGQIVAGQPIEVGHDSFATFGEEDAIELGSAMLPGKTDDLFALRVSGDSMIDAMVNDGDIVVMRQQETARNGDMVAVWLTPGDTTTLKYFFHEGDRIRLQPANPTMNPIYAAPEQVRVQGKVMMVVRQMA